MGAKIGSKVSALAFAAGWLVFTAGASVARGQEPSADKLIKEINVAIVDARRLVNEAETKRTAARGKPREGKERKELIEKASSLYGEAAETLSGGAGKSETLARQDDPKWYREYFTLYAKLLESLAQLGRLSSEELLIRLRGKPTEEQVQSWKENIERVNKENAEYRKRIAEIEAETGVVLIKP
jgi:chromosome segregation ATPase